MTAASARELAEKEGEKLTPLAKQAVGGGGKTAAEKRIKGTPFRKGAVSGKEERKMEKKKAWVFLCSKTSKTRANLVSRKGRGRKPKEAKALKM